MCAYLHTIRRPSGPDKEFLIQLFVEADAKVATVTTQYLLNKMFKDSNITFAKVCRLIINLHMYIVTGF